MTIVDDGLLYNTAIHVSRKPRERRGTADTRTIRPGAARRSNALIVDRRIGRKSPSSAVRSSETHPKSLAGLL